MDFVMQNWKFFLVGGIALFMGAKYSLPFLKGLIPVKKVNNSNVAKTEKIDQDCITHLRNRALLLKHSELIEEIKKIDTMFYDIHCEAFQKGIS